jgi:hypothetical protein
MSKNAIKIILDREIFHPGDEVTGKKIILNLNYKTFLNFSIFSGHVETVIEKHVEKSKGPKI